MSWTGEHEEAIENANSMLQTERSVAALVAAASAYYAGVGACVSVVKRQPWRVSMAWRAWSWSQTALALAEEARLRAMSDDMPVTYQLTLDQVDVMCTIWFRLGTAKQRWWGVELLTYAAVRLDARTAATHTLAFITLHRVRYGLVPWTEEIHTRVLGSAQRVAMDARYGETDHCSGMGQAARIMRQLAMMLPADDQRRAKHLQMAALYAKEGGVSDQLKKLASV